MKKILVSPSSFGKLDSSPLQMLQKEGFEVVMNPFGRKLSRQETLELAVDCVGVVAGVEEYDGEVLSQLTDLKCISRVGVGMDSIDMDAAQRNGVKVVNTPNGPTQAVAELALALTLSSLRRIGQAHANMKSGLWQKENGYLLQGKTIGVLGVGRIGRKTSEMFRALGCKVLGSDLFPQLNWAKNIGVTFVDTHDLFSHSDVVILHLPGSGGGKPTVGKRELDIMKDDATLINLARGGVLDEDALVLKLNEGKFAGVALDVFSSEPYDGDLLNHDKVLLTPHLGSYAREGKIQMELDAASNLIRVLNDQA